MKLDIENYHLRDANISFDEPTHTYTLFGDEVRGSVSALWASFFSKFDANKNRPYFENWYAASFDDAARKDWDRDGAERKRKKGKAKWSWGATKLYLSVVEGKSYEDISDIFASLRFFGEADEGDKAYPRLIWFLRKRRNAGKDDAWDRILRMWEGHGQRASEYGTALHRACELHANDENYDESIPETKYYLDFRRDHPDLVPYRTEWSLYAFAGAYAVVGQADALFTQKDELVMVDYKCCAHELSPDNPYMKFGSKPFDVVPDTSFGHYTVQQNIYRFILEKYYWKKPLKKCYLLQLHRNFGRYRLVEVPDLRKRVASLFDDLAKQTVARNVKPSAKTRWRAARRVFLFITFLSCLKIR